jgi:tRNA nucleotidyltransferase/poly(A) polymerase
MAIKQHRHPTGVRAAKSFETDSARRDFSINSLGINRHGQVIDYQGGVEDLKNKLIKAVGDPRQRFEEDALRILRALRFAVKLGFSIDPDTLTAAKELNHLVDSLSIERISQELYKVASISGPALADYLVKLDEIDLLKKILPELKELQNSIESPEHHPEAYNDTFP